MPITQKSDFTFNLQTVYELSLQFPPKIKSLSKIVRVHFYLEVKFDVID